jgi:DNA-binding NarL/FixJ family response regulator
VTQVEGPRAAAIARYVRAVADGDGNALDAASRDFETMGDLLAAADAAGQATGAHLDSGRRGASLTASARAARLASTCGGATSPAIAAAQMALPITRREREVAVLVSEGLSNREIAESMCLSVRTVECYVQRAYTKTGVSTRAELAGLIGR